MIGTLRRSDRHIARGALRTLKRLAACLAAGVGKGIAKLCRRFTVILVPEDHRPPMQASFSLWQFLFAAMSLSAGAVSIPALGLGTRSGAAGLTETAALYAEVQAEVDAYRDEVSALLKGAEPLREELDRIDFRERKRSKESVRIFLGFLSAPSREVPDVAELISLRESLDGAAASIEEAGTAIKNVRENIAEVPVLWPLKGGIGHISMAFGYIPNPFTGIPYIHKGLDIGNYRTGDRIVAAADGVVAAAFYDSVSGYGYNVILRHLHGYYTRYGHMPALKVRVGQKVRQGEVIGFVGNTGRTDGPHLHFEIQRGPDLLDPLAMLMRPAGGRR